MPTPSPEQKELPADVKKRVYEQFGYLERYVLNGSHPIWNKEKGDFYPQDTRKELVRLMEFLSEEIETAHHLGVMEGMKKSLGIVKKMLRKSKTYTPSIGQDTAIAQLELVIEALDQKES